MREHDNTNFGDTTSADMGLGGFEAEYHLAGGSALVVVDADQGVRNHLSEVFQNRVLAASSLNEVESHIGVGPTVVVLGPSHATSTDLEAIESWSRNYPNVAMVLIASELSTQLLHKALRVGIKDVLSSPIDQAQLIETIDRVAEMVPVADHLPKAGSPTDPSNADGGRGRVISVFSTKGGSGKSVVATNLALVLAQKAFEPVVLIDGHLQFGDVAVMLKMNPQRTVVDALYRIEELDNAMLEAIMTQHQPSGLMVLPAPMDPTFADQISGVEMAKLVRKIKSFAGHIIIDLPSVFNDVVLNLIEVSDDIVFVAGLDIPNIKNVKVGLSTLNKLDVSKDKLHILLNRADSRVKLDVSEVERTLGVRDVVHLPSDVVVPISVNKGEPVVISAPKSSVSRAFEQLADRFIDESHVGEALTSAPSSGRRKFFG